jgi:kinesin family protein 18/19
MSYYQIYNEQIKDLLIRDNRQPMDICEDPVKGTVITNLAQVEITSRSEILDLLALGNQNRIIGCTDKNMSSSRSHAVMQLHITRQEVTKPKPTPYSAEEED